MILKKKKYLGKIVNILCHQGNENKNCLESPSHSIRAANSQKTTTDVGDDAVKQSYTSLVRTCAPTAAREIIVKVPGETKGRATM